MADKGDIDLGGAQFASHKWAEPVVSGYCRKVHTTKLTIISSLLLPSWLAH